MKLLNELTIKNLKLNKKRTIVTIIGITLSVALITAVASLYASGVSSFINYDKKKDGDYHVAYYDVPKEDISVFENNVEIEKINIKKDLGYAKIASKNEYKPYAYVMEYDENALTNLAVNIVEGRLPQNNSEIIIPTHLRTNGRLSINIGEKITLDIGKRIGIDDVELKQINPFQKNDETGESSEKIVDTVSKTYTVVGTFQRPQYDIEGYSAPGYSFITYLDNNDISGTVSVYTRYTKSGLKKVYELTAGILGVDEELFSDMYREHNMNDEKYERYSEEAKNEKYDFTFNYSLIGLETDPIKSSDIVGLGAVIAFVILIIVITSIFCIKNSFDISITEKNKQYGMLRSTGATKKQIRKNVFFEATILGLIGIPLGLIFGFLATFILVNVSNVYFANINSDIELKFVFSFIAVIVAVILGIITMYFSAFKSARRASKVSPIDSIRNSAEIKIKPNKLKTPKIIRKIFGVGGEISYKNLKRNKKKYRTTVTSIVVSVAVFVGLASFMNILLNMVDDKVNASDYNISLSSHDLNDENYEMFLDATQLDNINDYSVIRYTTFSYDNPKFNPEYLEWIGTEAGKKDVCNVYALGEEQYEKYVKSLGLNVEEMKDKVILYDLMKNILRYDSDETGSKERKDFNTLDYKKGDTIDGIIEKDTPYTAEIGATTDKLPFGLKDQDLKRMYIVSDELFDGIVTKNTDIKIVFDSSNANKLQDDLETVLSDAGAYNINNIAESVNRTRSLVTLAGIFLYGFIIVISLIGVTNIFNTITTSIELRSPEFAMLKSVGMTKHEFNRMISLESIFMGIKSLLIGIPLGILASFVITILFAEGNYIFPVIPVVISIVTVFILLLVIMKYSISKVNKQNTIETIRNENI